MPWINFKLWYIFYIYITVDIIFLYYTIFFFIFIFVEIILVQFCIILVTNGFIKKHKSPYLVIILYFVIDTMNIYAWKKIDKILTHFGDALFRK